MELTQEEYNKSFDHFAKHGDHAPLTAKAEQLADALMEATEGDADNLTGLAVLDALGTIGFTITEPEMFNEASAAFIMGV